MLKKQKSTKWIALCSYSYCSYKSHILQAKKYESGHIEFNSIQINSEDSSVIFETNLVFAEEFDKLLKMEIC